MRSFFHLTAILLAAVLLSTANSQTGKVSAQLVTPHALPPSSAADFSSLPFQKCWIHPVPNINPNSIASDNVSTVYVSSSNGILTALQNNSGQKIWESILGGEIISEPEPDVNRGSIYVVTKSSDYSTKADKTKEKISENNDEKKLSFKLWSLSSHTGLTNWQINLEESSGATSAAPPVPSYLSLNGGSLIVTGINNRVMSVGTDSGKIEWVKALDGKLSAVPFFLDDVVYAATVPGNIFVISTAGGREIKKIGINETVTSVFAAPENTLTVGLASGEVTTFNYADGKNRWKLRGGGEIAGIFNTPRGLLIASFDNFIYLVSPKNGKIIWKKRLEGRLAGDPLILDNSILVTVAGLSRADFINLTDGKIFNTIILENDNNYSGHSEKIGEMLFFPTLNGLLGMAASADKCRDYKND